jgi:hypothetical protein
MQKVVGSSPIIRFLGGPAVRGFSMSGVSPIGDTDFGTAALLPIGAQSGALHQRL